VAVIPNGVDIPAPAPFADPGHDRTLLYLGRLHPKKGLDQLLRAWARVEPLRPDWRLLVLGPSEEGYGERLRRLAESLGLRRARFGGPVYGDDKLAAYTHADLFVLPSLNENFGLTVAEALASGVPVISSKGAPWSGLEKERCGWWVDRADEALAAALESATALPRQALVEMGQRGRGWMLRDFSWRVVAGQMAAVYDWLAQRGDRPSCVRCA
jgi:glycosyltransferase involved in cell wall biosynthesis